MNKSNIENIKNAAIWIGIFIVLVIIGTFVFYQMDCQRNARENYKPDHNYTSNDYKIEELDDGNLLYVKFAGKENKIYRIETEYVFKQNKNVKIIETEYHVSLESAIKSEESKHKHEDFIKVEREMNLVATEYHGDSSLKENIIKTIEEENVTKNKVK